MERRKKQDSSSSYWLFLLAALVLLAAAALLLPVQREYKMKRQELDGLRRELDSKRANSAVLSKEVSDLQTSPEAVERVAREKYNLCRDGETVLESPELPDRRQRPEQRRTPR